VAHRTTAVVVLAVLLGGQPRRAGPPRKFYDDDPISREPETRDASKVQRWSINLTYDLAANLFTRQGDRRPIKAQNVNTIDEVPIRTGSPTGSARGPSPLRRSHAAH
jgi:hypothetical protein